MRHKLETVAKRDTDENREKVLITSRFIPNTKRKYYSSGLLQPETIGDLHRECA
jgi:hypothetical protein